MLRWLYIFVFLWFHEIPATIILNAYRTEPWKSNSHPSQSFTDENRNSMSALFLLIKLFRPLLTPSLLINKIEQCA